MISLKTLIKDIDCLVTCKGNGKKAGSKMKDAGIIQNGYIIIEDSIISEVGSGNEYTKYTGEFNDIIDGIL